MIYQGTPTYYNSDFEHFGIKGMKWGVRRYQNPDGSLTSAGKKRLAKRIVSDSKKDSSYHKWNSREMVVNRLKKDAPFDLKLALSKIREKRKAWVEAEKKSAPDYYDSDQHIKDSAKAYAATKKWFKDTDPETYKGMVALNKGDDAGLDRFHDFRKTFEGFESDYWEQGKKKYDANLKKQGLDPDAAHKAWRDYDKACNDAAEDLIGKYGSIRLKNYEGAYSWNNVNGIVNELISDSLSKIDTDDWRSNNSKTT